MNESPNRRAVIVGVFVLLGILFFVGGILMIGNLHETFKNKMEVVSLFDDVNGLQKGNNVWFSGVKVGTVSSLHFYGKSQVEVRIKIDTKTQQYIRRDAMVKISSDGIIGNKILIIYGGTATSQMIQEGDTLGVEKTFSTEDMINTLQENNKNFLAISNDFKVISKGLVAGEGTIGKLLKDDAVYANINATTASLQLASAKAQALVASLATFSANLNKKGTLANELTTDTVVFKSVKASVFQLQQMADNASALITDLKKAGTNPNSTIGVLLRDETSGARMKETIKNLESSSLKLDEDLKAAQSSFLLKGYFKKKAKEDAKANDSPEK
jgi:phospholipid/cholesterol/gamma-HCH transport system substrate-binding protein